MWAEALNPSGTNPFLFCRSNTPPQKKTETSKNQTEKTEAIEGEFINFLRENIKFNLKIFIWDP